jgi:hypothetical protein
VAEQGPHPGTRRVGRRQAVAVREVEASPKVRGLDRFRNERNAQFLREVVLVPRIMVSEQVRHRNPPIGPAREQSLKPNEPFRDEVAIFDVPVEHVAQQVQVVDVRCVGLQALNERRFLRPLRRAGPTPKVHVGNKENHGTEQEGDE